MANKYDNGIDLSHLTREKAIKNGRRIAAEERVPLNQPTANLPKAMERVKLNLRGTGERRLSGHLGTAENLMRNAQALDTGLSEERKKSSAEERNAKHYRDILASGKLNGVPLTAAQRRQFEQLAERAERKSGTYSGLQKDLQKPLGDVISAADRKGDELEKSSQKHLAKGREGLSRGWGTVYDVGSAGADLLADAAENAIIPGAGTFGRISRMYGQGSEKAQDADSNLLQQTLAGGATAGIGESVNRLFSSNPLLKKAYGKGALDDILFPNLGKTVPGAMAKSFLGEGAEEGLEDILDEAAENIIYDHENKDKLTAKEVGYDALVGAILGGLTGASNVKRFRPQETSAEPTQTAQDSVSPSAPTTDTPKANVRPTAVNEDSSVVAENATTTPTGAENATVRENRTVSNAENVESDPVALKHKAEQIYESARRSGIESIGGEYAPDDVNFDSADETGSIISEQDQANAYAAALGMDYQTIQSLGIWDAWSDLSHDARIGDDASRYSPMAAAKALRWAVDEHNSGKNHSYGELVERAFAEDGKATPESVHRQYFPTEAERADDAERERRRQKDMASYIKAKAKADTAREKSRASVDPLIAALTKGKRVDNSALTNEQFDALADRSDLDVDAEQHIYQVKPEQHIDNRGKGEIADRRVKAFQYDHPGVQKYYRPAAEQLLVELTNYVPGGRTETATGEYGQTYSWRTKRNASPRIAALLDGGMKRDDIEAALDAIIKDKGAENYANAKRIEMVIDDMLTNGYSDGTQFIPSNADYIAEKGQIPGNKVDEIGHGLDDIDPETSTPINPDGVTGRNDMNPSMGAADAGFDGGFAGFQGRATNFHPINEDAAQRTMEEQGRAPSEVPKTNPDTGKYIGKNASTIINSPLTSNEMSGVFEEAVANGKADKVPIPDAKRAADAVKAVEDAKGDYRIVAKSFLDMVDGDKRISPQDVVNAIHAYNLANQAGDDTTAFLLGEALYSMGGESGSMLRSFSFFNRLTPTGHLLSLRRTLERINKNAPKGRKKRLTENVEALFNQAIEQANTQRDDAINTMIEAMQAYAEILGVGKNGKTPDLADVMKRVAKGKGSAADIDSKIDETQRSWIEELAKELGKNVERKANQGKPRENTVFELISSDLNKFLDSYFPKDKSKGKQRTAADRIADYLNNKEQYQAAWAKAQDALQQKYADDPDMLAKLDEWSYSTLGYTGSGSDAVLLKAIADAALESDVSLKETLIRGEYDPQNLGAEIAADIIKKLGLYGKPDAATIVDAANRYVERRSADLAYKRGKGADSYFEGDIRKDMSAIGTKMADIIRQGADSKEALAKRIADMMVGQYHVSPEGAQRIANDITAKFNSMVNDAAKRQLESMFKDRPKPEQKTMQKHFEELANMGAFTDPRFNTKATSKVFGTGGVTIDEKKAQAYLDAKTDEERHDAWEALLDDAASKVSSTLMDKFTALRYINMLGTLKGPERNVLGNVGMMMMSSVNNQVNTFLERATKSGKTRSHTVDRARMKAAADYFQTIKGYAMGEQKYADSSSTKGEVAREVMDRRRVYKSNLMEGARKGTNWILNNKYFGDEAFSRHAFSRALAGYMKANGVTAEQFANPEWRAQHADFVSKATDFSAKQAQENTFRDSNTFSSWISKIGRRPDTPWYGRMASEGLSPFRKTPANVLVRAEEYSPLGLINAAVKQAQRMAGNSEITGADVVQSLSKSLTGTGLFVLGMALKNSGLLRGADDEDDEQAAFDDLQGHQEYSLELPDGTSVTLSWLSPIAMPLFMGAQFWTLAQEDGIEAKDLENALTSLADPMLEMSMLSGVEDTIGKFKYADGSNLGQIAVSTMLGYLTQGLTNTLVGQISRLGEDESMMTYVDRDSPVPPWLQKELGKISRKTPGWDYQQVPYIDAWGRSEKTGDYLTRAMNNLANPAFTSQVDSTFVDEELQKLADRTGETSIFPNRAECSFDVNGKKWNMNAQQWERYAREKGTTAHKTLDSLMHSPEWRSLSDEDKLDAIEKAYTYSSAKAKSSVNHSYKPGDAAKAALESALPLDKYILYQKTADADGNKRTSGSESAKALLNLSGVTNETRGQVWAQKNKQTAPEKNPFTGTLHRYGVSPEKAVDIHSYYSQINKMDAKDKDKARWFADYISRQGLTSTQIAAAKQTYRFWGSYPIRYK